MATGSGLDSQVAFGAETTWGTAVTPDRALEFNSESLSKEPTWLEPTGLAAGRKFKRESRVRQSRITVSGDVTMEHATKGMGLMWAHALASGATATQIGTTTAYSQIHTPGDYRGLGLTVQVGRPEPSSGTVQPFTFAGCKVASWEFSLTSGEVPTLTLSVDGRDEDTTTALAAASYLTGASVFDFSQFTLKLGGTVSTTGGETSISGGTAVATVVNEVTLGGESPKAVERFGVGNQGLKSEQLENDIPTMTGTLAAEFNKTELYDVFSGNTTTAMQLTAVGEEIGTTGEFFTLDFIYPAIKLKTAAPAVEGPDIVQMSTEFEAYDDETNPVVQVKLISDETTI